MKIVELSLYNNPVFNNSVYNLTSVGARNELIHCWNITQWLPVQLNNKVDAVNCSTVQCTYYNTFWEDLVSIDISWLCRQSAFEFINS